MGITNFKKTIFLGMIVFCLANVYVQAVTTTYTSYTDWFNALNGSNVTLFNFEGYDGQTVNQVPLYSNSGVSFRSLGNGTYPIHLSGPISATSGTSLIGNHNNAGFDEFQNGIVWDFTVPVNAVAWYKNTGDANRYRIYSTTGQLLAEINLDAPGNLFGGFISDQLIGFASTINLPPQDGLFGIDNLQFALTSTVPEPSAIILVLLGILTICYKNYR